MNITACLKSRGIFTFALLSAMSPVTLANDYYCINAPNRDAFSTYVGYEHAIQLDGIADDLHFLPPGFLDERGDGTATLHGTLVSDTHPDMRFNVRIDFAGAMTAGEPGLPPGSPNQQLLPAAYVAQGGPVDTATWRFYTSYSGTLKGLDGLYGAVIQVAATGPAFQIGIGASNENVGLGASGGFSATVTKQPDIGPALPLSFGGDVTLAMSEQCGMCGEETENSPVSIWPTGHAFLMLGGVGTDFVFDAPGHFDEHVDGTALLSGTIASLANPGRRFAVEMEMSSRVDPGDVGYAPFGNPYKELMPAYYYINGGPIDTLFWHYYKQVAGKLTGMDDYAGALVTFTGMGPALQIGYGASGKDLSYGVASWLAFKTVQQPNNGNTLPDEYTGDMNASLAAECTVCAAKADANPSSLYSGGFALTLYPLGSDFVFIQPGTFEEYSDHTASVTGTVVRMSDPDAMFAVELQFSDRVDAGDPTFPPAGSPKLELVASAYVNNGGPIDPATWHYYQTTTGTLTGLGDYAGALLSVARLGPSFQVGFGANGKNFAYGASGWLDITTVQQPDSGKQFPVQFAGDGNLDLVQNWATEPGAASVVDYGIGCPGSGGYTPELTVLGLPEPGNEIMLRIQGGNGGAPAMLVVGQGQGMIALPNGCFSNLVNPLVYFGPFNLTGVGAGNGGVIMSLTTPAIATATDLTMEAYVQDAGAPGGVSLTNGVAVHVP